MYYCLECETVFLAPVERPDPVDPSRSEWVCPNCAGIEYTDIRELDK